MTLKPIFDAIERSAHRIRDAITNEDLCYSQQCNSTGDMQLKLDIQSDLIIAEEFSKITAIKAIASEEKEEAETLHPNGRYMIAYDPLDGSSLIDVDLSVGSIFGIYDGEFQASNMLASVYVVYGPRLELVTAYKGGVRHYIFRHGRFMEQETIKLNEKGKLNAPGGTQKHWPPHHKKMIDGLFAEGYRLRYSGGMVPDLHQILLKGGGLFSYPGTTDKPEGKLRKLFEVFPFAFVYETAGGEAIDEKGRRLMELSCDDPHETTPCFFGSKYEISKVKAAYDVD
ncbi:class 1 fructose-bisphosphatase [Hydrogenimonas cancrithermarum]|uniref:Fructose-1,6-bisphosphatase class 1 n=1 Tax=Hydrogenimonas cancrithermarum TaxID=2993563 RepID=A0ABM8FPK2_9BACT|nr:class 1 fructose-bisphosphatase [Hydrogenimonas cancrithermarum]BDY13935.1 fructose-1,6-bisphosphatase class 1 [Hydrogenimonas cancrithermarum]